MAVEEEEEEEEEVAGLRRIAVNTNAIIAAQNSPIKQQ